MRNENVEIYSDQTNAAIMRHPGRRFPGVLIQGDSLYALCARADRACAAAKGQLDPQAYGEINALRNGLWDYLTHYKTVLAEPASRVGLIQALCLAMDYREADDSYFELVEKHGDELFAVVGRTQFPKTYGAMLGFVIKTNSLKTAMFDMVDSNNPYAFKALFRCFCDHYIKFQYLFIRFLHENTDEVGDDYFNLCGASEMVEYLDSIRVAEALIGNEVALETERAIHKLYPRVAGMSKRQLADASAKFKYRSILRFLAEAAPGIISQERPFLAAIIPSYALLSSFVHGGPWTDRDMRTYVGEEALEECEERAGLVFAMTASVFLFSVMAVSREHKEFLPLASQINQVMRDYLSPASSGEA